MLRALISLAFASLAFVLASGAVLRPAFAAGARHDGADGAEDRWDARLGAEASVATRWIWRGVALSRGPVAQPSVSAAAIGLTAEASWALLENAARDGPSAASLEVARPFAWRGLEVGPGFAVYARPRERTAEATLEAAFARGPVRLTTAHAVDVGANPYAWFGTAGGGLTLARGAATVTVEASLGFASAAHARAYFHRDGSFVDLALASASGRYDFTPHVYAAVRMEGSALLSPSLRKSHAEPTLGAASLALGFEL